MKIMLFSCLLHLALFELVLATPIIYDGRAPFNLTDTMLDVSEGPYLTVVKGSAENASYYSHLLGYTAPPTPLWNEEISPLFPVVTRPTEQAISISIDNSSLFPVVTRPTEQAISISIDNSSIFIPGDGIPQTGFRRTEFIAQANGSNTALDAVMELNITVFHVSIQGDILRPLNYTHEYQIVFIEPDDGSHVFEIQLGSPFTDPSGPLPARQAHSFKVRDHALNVLYIAPFTMETWHNFAVQVDWNNRTLVVYYSTDENCLEAVTDVLPNQSTPAGSSGQGDYHFGVLKLPLADPAETLAEQENVVYYGIQEGDTEALLYSGVFVESITGGISAGNGRVIPPVL